MKRAWLLLFLVHGLVFYSKAQTADFTIPDTICANAPVDITNVQPPAATSYKWSFCAGNASYEPDGMNIGNPGQLLNAPRFIALVQDNSEYYTFTTSTGNSKVLMCYYGTGLTHSPSLIRDLGNFGVLSNQVGGIQVKNDNGIWYGFVLNGNKLVRLVFGPSLLSVPTSFVAVSMAAVTTGSGLAITKEGTNWVGFLTDIDGDNLVRLDFGLSLANTPQEHPLGNLGQLNRPSSIVLANENNKWYAFICNIGSSTLTRVVFGTSLLNQVPQGLNLMNVGGLNLNAGISLINDCGGYNGFVTNCVIESDLCILHLVFPHGLGGQVTGYHIANNGVLNKPYGISDVLRNGDTLYGFVANYGSSSMTRMFFPSCSNASQPFFIGQNPPPVRYPEPGNYNILLTVNDGQANQSSQCRNIVVIEKPALSLGPDREICQGKTTLLDAGAGNNLYAWSTGATTQSITVSTPGTYWIHKVNPANCEANDTIVVNVGKTESVFVDTTICAGLSYWAQHAMQTTGGIYHDTLRMANGCDSVVTTNLQVKECPLLIWFPNAFTPDGDGVNDFFRPVGQDITKYTLQIYDRWGAMIFVSEDIGTGWDGMVNGTWAMPAVYTFVVVFESIHYPGVTEREAGTFTLIR